MPRWGATSSSQAFAITSRSGTAPHGASSWKRSKGVWSLLPSALQRSRTDHVPVLAEEVRELVAVRPGQTVVDATFGAGGHARVLAEDLGGRGKLVALDRDPTAKT